MRSLFASAATLALSAIVLSGCLSDTTLYHKKVSGKFNNADFAFIKGKYPMVLDAKGVDNDSLRGDLIAIMSEEYQNHHKFHNAELVSALDFKEDSEISYVIEVNSNPKATAKNTCSADTPHLKKGADLSAISAAHIAFCRKDVAITYISTKFEQPVAATSEEFRYVISIAADSILYRKDNPFTGCGPMPTDC